MIDRTKPTEQEKKLFETTAIVNRSNWIMVAKASNTTTAKEAATRAATQEPTEIAQSETIEAHNAFQTAKFYEAAAKSLIIRKAEEEAEEYMNKAIDLEQEAERFMEEAQRKLKEAEAAKDKK